MKFLKHNIYLPIAILSICNIFGMEENFNPKIKSLKDQAMLKVGSMNLSETHLEKLPEELRKLAKILVKNNGNPDIALKAIINALQTAENMPVLLNQINSTGINIFPNELIEQLKTISTSIDNLSYLIEELLILGAQPYRGSMFLLLLTTSPNTGQILMNATLKTYPNFKFVNEELSEALGALGGFIGKSIEKNSVNETELDKFLQLYTAEFRTFLLRTASGAWDALESNILASMGQINPNSRSILNEIKVLVENRFIELRLYNLAIE